MSSEEFDEQLDYSEYESDDFVPKAKRQKNRFIDAEAEVDDTDDDSDDAEEGFENDFISDDIAYHPTLSIRDLEAKTDAEVHEIVASMDKKYGRTRRPADASAPQEQFVPTVEDPRLWIARVREGSERRVVVALMKRAADLKLPISSVFCRDDLRGVIYVESFSESHAMEALRGIPSVLTRKVRIVEIDDMIGVLTITKKSMKTLMKDKEWARIRRGKYNGDLVRVMDISETGMQCSVRIIPRIGQSMKKRPRNDHTNRPPQQFFDPRLLPKELARRVCSRPNGVYTLGADAFVDGYLEKTIRTSALDLEACPPTLDELDRFLKANGAIDQETLLSIKLSFPSRDTRTVFSPGDRVHVGTGELLNAPAVIVSLDGADKATVKLARHGARMVVPLSKLTRLFEVGDTIKVVSGKYMGLVGMVVNVRDRIATLVTGDHQTEVQAFTSDLQIAKEITNIKKTTQHVNKQQSLHLRKRDSNPVRAGVRVRLGEGRYKGYVGIIKRVLIQSCRADIELEATGEIVPSDIKKLNIWDDATCAFLTTAMPSLTPVKPIHAQSWGFPREPLAATPRTEDTRTSTWDAGARTPRHMADEDWGVGSNTPGLTEE